MGRPALSRAGRAPSWPPRKPKRQLALRAVHLPGSELFHIRLSRRALQLVGRATAIALTTKPFDLSNFIHSTYNEYVLTKSIGQWAVHNELLPKDRQLPATLWSSRLLSNIWPMGSIFRAGTPGQCLPSGVWQRERSQSSDDWRGRALGLDRRILGRQDPICIYKSQRSQHHASEERAHRLVRRGCARENKRLLYKPSERSLESATRIPRAGHSAV